MGKHQNETSTKKSKTRNKQRRRYSIVSADRHVFNLIGVLGLSFLSLYLFGTSLPGWFIVEDNVNTSSCASATQYLPDFDFRLRDGKSSKLYVSSSLWYLNIRLEKEGTTSSQYLPFVFLPKSYEGTHVLCNGVLGMITFTLLILGVVFTISASPKPSKMVYYGLSQVAIVTAGSTWMMASFEASQNYVTSVARDFCLDYVLLSTSLSLQILTGSCAVLAFIMGCILIHIATILNTNDEYNAHARRYDVISSRKMAERDDNDDDLLLDV